MSAINPDAYYECNYCDHTWSYPSGIPYTDNSGLNGLCYDMCSMNCVKKHIDFLMQTEPDIDIREYLVESMWLRPRIGIIDQYSKGEEQKEFRQFISTCTRYINATKKKESEVC
jgi:hypothetical protein